MHASGRLKTQAPRKFNMRDRRAFWRGAIMNYDEVEDAARGRAGSRVPRRTKASTRADAGPGAARGGHTHTRTNSQAVACSNEHGNYARLQALALTLEHPESVDAKCVYAETCRPWPCRVFPRRVSRGESAPPSRTRAAGPYRRAVSVEAAAASCHQSSASAAHP